MSVKNLRCTVYLAKSICDGIVKKYGIGYIHLMNGLEHTKS